MWCEKRISKSGETTYKFVERYTCPYSGKSKKVSVTYKKNNRQSAKAAYTELQEIINKIINTGVTSDKPLELLLTEYIEYRKPFVKPSTNYGHNNMLKAIMAIFPKGILISKLTTALLQITLSEFMKSHSYSYTKSIFCLIRQSLKYAKRLGYISDISFLEDIELPRQQKTVRQVKKERSKFLTKDELTDVLTRLREINPKVSLICEFQALTGLRIGELAALRTQDFDRNNHSIDVNGTLATHIAEGSERRLSPKNVYSIRTVTLDMRALQIIKHFIVSNSARRLVNHSFNPDNYIFVTDGGQPYDHHYINKILKRLQYRKPISTHTFRHTHISLLAEANVPLKAIMERVGHNEPRTTLSIYTHVTDEMRNELNTAINSIGKSIISK